MISQDDEGLWVDPNELNDTFSTYYGIKGLKWGVNRIDEPSGELGIPENDHSVFNPLIISLPYSVAPQKSPVNWSCVRYEVGLQARRAATYTALGFGVVDMMNRCKNAIELVESGQSGWLIDGTLFVLYLIVISYYTVFDIAKSTEESNDHPSS